MDDNQDDNDLRVLPKNTIERGSEFDVMRKDPTLRQAYIGVGWDLKAIEGDPLDLDVSIFLLDKNEQTRVDEDFVFYNNMTGADGAVRHTGDNRTGAGDGDDETIYLDFNGLTFDVTKVVIVVSIYQGDLQEQDFSSVRNVYMRLTNAESDIEIFRYELDEDMGNGTALLVGELERIGPKWMFKALGESFIGGLAGVASSYGILVREQVQA